MQQNNKHEALRPSCKSVRFHGILAALCVATLLCGLETTVVTTSLPTIVHELNIGDDYVWITNALFLTSTAVQPLFGQLANIFGRRWLALSIVGIYILGSGICGGANSGTVLIVGRSIQGAGTGGLNMILDIILSDLVPLRERGVYIAITLVVLTIGTSMGPFVGGAIVEKTSWRWVFYVNLPFGVISFVLLFMFLQVGHEKEASWRKKLERIDFVGNTLLMVSTTTLLYALTYGGSRYPWLSTEILLPLLFGFGGLAVFALFEQFGWAKEPVIPLRLFRCRTTLVVFVNTFLSAVLLYWAIFYLSVYFQAVLVSSPTHTGVQMLPVVLVAVPGAAVAVIILSKFGRYKALHTVGFATVTVGLGLFSTLDQNAEMSQWVAYQVVIAIGTGMVLNTLLPAFQAGQPERDQATATASWAFIRSFGTIWGVTIPAAIFNNRLETSLRHISDPRVRGELAHGQAYGHATHEYISKFEDPIRSEIIETFVVALRYTWWISIPFSGLAFLLALVEKDIPLRTELHTEFGLEDSQLDRTGKTEHP
ncbi:MFS general substrate transporter [Polychaeton citri CBS 116435]|uniref:MFS general substrate transporter n=1 Tax=Polychaeton citri CBS 116435 TaxID=1314669 RepID=A0A9P4UJK4_9PEZI|nr:MFS general substrate transporter [Polychaeton citri CBS 116435]